MRYQKYLLQNHFNLVKVTIEDNPGLLRLFHLTTVGLGANVFIEIHVKHSGCFKSIFKIPPLVEDDSPYFVQLCLGAAGEGSPSCANFKTSSKNDFLAKMI